MCGLAARPASPAGRCPVCVRGTCLLQLPLAAGKHGRPRCSAQQQPHVLRPSGLSSSASALFHKAALRAHRAPTGWCVQPGAGGQHGRLRGRAAACAHGAAPVHKEGGLGAAPQRGQRAGGHPPDGRWRSRARACGPCHAALGAGPVRWAQHPLPRALLLGSCSAQWAAGCVPFFPNHQEEQTLRKPTPAERGRAHQAVWRRSSPARGTAGAAAECSAPPAPRTLGTSPARGAAAPAAGPLPPRRAALRRCAAARVPAGRPARDRRPACSALLPVPWLAAARRSCLAGQHCSCMSGQGQQGQSCRRAQAGAL